ncbi:hypothetical protein [Levilactobacillus wangkuiensis]|uniref:hypothetical protein n=1 Tax=Levilactobacillus wangkuiensis TaxID=2799566 RepID=UPI00194389AE|nr:hypothetical protein [Levilactobacillus wangkuiensis]
MELSFDNATDNVFVQGVITALLPALKEQLEEKDDLLTAKQLNAQYFHVGNDAIGAVVHQHGFPKTKIPGSSTFKYSRKAVEKFIADHQIY